MRLSRTMLIALVALLGVPSLVAAQTYPSGKDPRSGLKSGRFDAGVAAKNMRLVSFSPKPAQFDTARGLTFINSDLAFGNGKYVYQGNFAGFTIWDVSDPAKPQVVSVVACITSQGDPSIVRQPALHLGRGRRQPQRLREGRCAGSEGPHGGRSHLRRLEPCRRRGS